MGMVGWGQVPQNWCSVFQWLQGLQTKEGDEEGCSTKVTKIIEQFGTRKELEILTYRKLNCLNCLTTIRFFAYREKTLATNSTYKLLYIIFCFRVFLMISLCVLLGQNA